MTNLSAGEEPLHALISEVQATAASRIRPELVAADTSREKLVIDCHDLIHAVG